MSAAIDVLHGELGSYNLPLQGPITPYSITVYPRAAEGNVAPLRVLSGSSSGVNYPQGIAVDVLRHEVFIANEDSITVYAMNADGAVIPLRTIAGPKTLLHDIRAMALDALNHEIFVSDEISMHVFAEDADGNVAPMQNFFVNHADVLTKLVVDPLNHELFGLTLWPLRMTADTQQKYLINVYPRDRDSGLVNPARSMEVEMSVAALTLDTRHDEILAVGHDASRPMIAAFARFGDGKTSPQRSFGVSKISSSDIAVDCHNNEIFTTGVRVYARTARGEAVEPLRLLTDSSSGESIALAVQ